MAAPQKPVLVVGDLMRDIVVHPKGPIRRGSDTVASISIVPGGSAGNQAAWLAHCGVPVTLLSRVGQRDLSMLENELQGFGIGSALVPDPDAQSGRLICMIDPDGERSFLTDRGAGLNLCVDDAKRLQLNDYSHICLSGYLFFSETGRKVGQYVIAEAQKLDVPVLLDPASAGFIQDVGVANFLDWTRGANFVLPNEDEARVLTGADNPSDQLRVLLKTYQNVILKRGGAGATALVNDRELSATAAAIEMVDSTGAGDAFLAGYVGALKSATSNQNALDEASLWGTMACGVSGGRPDPSIEK